MKPELRLDDVADLAGRQAERRVLELLRHAAAAEVVEIAALRRRSLVLGILLRQGREIGARLRLLQQRFRPRLDRGFVLALGLQQDVAGAHLLGRRELRLVGAVKALDLRRRHDRLRRGPARVSMSRYLILRFSPIAVRLLVPVEPVGDVLVGHADVVPQLVGRDDDQLGLHLLVAPLVLVVHLGIAHVHPFGERARAASR